MKVSAIKKIIAVVVLMVCTLVCVNNTKTYAAETAEIDEKNEHIVRIAGVDDIINAGNDFINKGEKGAGEIGNGGFDISPTGFVEQFIDVGRILVGVAIATILIVAMIMGVKWITATPDKQAKLKGQLVGLVIAAVVIFGAVGIWNLVWGIMEKTQEQLNAASSETIVIAELLTEEKGGI